MLFANTCVPKLPFVTTLTMSKTFITRTTSVVTTTPIVVPICGNVTRQNTWLSVAPSILAASISSVGTALIAADRITIAKPVWIQIRMTINQKLLYGVSLDEQHRLRRDVTVGQHPESADAAADDADESDEQPTDEDRHDAREDHRRPTAE